MGATGHAIRPIQVAGDLVYFGDGIGRLHAVDRHTGKERWMFRTGATVFSSPTVAGRLVIVGSTDGAIYALRTAAAGEAAVQRAVFFDSSYLRALRPRRQAILTIGVT